MAKSWYEIKAAAKDGATEISIYDEVGMWGVTAAMFARDLKALGDVRAITLRLNSPGGSVTDGIAIYNLLRDHKAKITVRIDGIAASIAGYIAMAGDRVVMPENTFLMIHNPAALAAGEADDLRDVADVLDKMRAALIGAYVAKSGLSADEVGAIMDEETWFTAAEAQEKGFADEVTGAVKMAAKFDPDHPVIKAKMPAALRSELTISHTAANDHGWGEAFAAVARQSEMLPPPPEKIGHGWDEVIAKHNESRGF